MIFWIAEAVLLLGAFALWGFVWSQQKHRDSQWNNENEVEREIYFNKNHQV